MIDRGGAKKDTGGEIFRPPIGTTGAKALRNLATSYEVAGEKGIRGYIQQVREK